MYFGYSPKNGILHYLFDTYRLLYPKYFALQESDHIGSNRIENAFDFNYSTDSYWVATKPSGHFSVCFPFHSLTIESFELTTSNWSCRPLQFGAEVSIDGNMYFGYQEYSPNMTQLQTKRFPFRTDKTEVRCFKFKSIQSTCKDTFGYGPDIDQIEFFGYLTEIKQEVGAFGCKKEIKYTCLVGRNWRFFGLFLPLMFY